MTKRKLVIVLPIFLTIIIVIFLWPILSNLIALTLTNPGKQVTTEYNAVVQKTAQAAVPSSLDQLDIPKSATVLTLTGLNFNVTNYMPDLFQGIFSKPPYTLKKIDYPASTASDSITKGVRNLDIMLKLTPGPIIVLAHSQGAQVASRWMREHSGDANAPDKDRLTFVLAGNPLRATGGYIVGRKEVGGTIGQPTPTDTKWHIVDIARRYEGWADWPNDTDNKWAVRAAEAGKKAYHTHYNDVNLYDSDNTVWSTGNTTFVLTEEDLPILKNKTYPGSVISNVRSFVESAYLRAPNDQLSATSPVDQPFWKLALNIWGIKQQ